MKSGDMFFAILVTIGACLMFFSMIIVAMAITHFWVLFAIESIIGITLAVIIFSFKEWFTLTFEIYELEEKSLQSQT